MVLIRVLANLLILQLSYAQKSSELVIGGVECDINEHRFLAAFFKYQPWTFQCAGTLIHEQWVLGAAHCYKRGLNIYLGMHNQSIQFDDEQRRYAIEEHYYRCDEKLTKWEKDVMLLKLNKPVRNSTHIAPLSLPSSPPSIGSFCRVMGWGIMSSTKDILPDVPHCANIKLVNYTECVAPYPNIPVTTRLWCAGVLEGGIDTCHQDSGGPLICDGQFQGIVAFGRYPCAQPRVPALYTKVSNYTDWIQNIIAGKTTTACPP
uniref:Snake venom serine protease Dav-X n=1 Tax=Deinagkistrodon acutus TaxID=36307 RepID=VSP4_DEIAC|nr:RecName: Full=Snake venom serine protease Dav-X; Short=SVSP; Flags: Precursor [Deinagkistrodon acutus]AAF76380.1 thrombin-like protein precursor [Deinagkistrodon acutus]